MNPQAKCVPFRGNALRMAYIGKPVLRHMAVFPKGAIQMIGLHSVFSRVWLCRCLNRKDEPNCVRSSNSAFRSSSDRKTRHSYEAGVYGE